MVRCVLRRNIDGENCVLRTFAVGRQKGSGAVIAHPGQLLLALNSTGRMSVFNKNSHRCKHASPLEFTWRFQEFFADELANPRTILGPKRHSNFNKDAETKCIWFCKAAVGGQYGTTPTTVMKWRTRQDMDNISEGRLDRSFWRPGPDHTWPQGVPHFKPGRDWDKKHATGPAVGGFKAGWHGLQKRNGETAQNFAVRLRAHVPHKGALNFVRRSGGGTTFGDQSPWMHHFAECGNPSPPVTTAAAAATAATIAGCSTSSSTSGSTNTSSTNTSSGTTSSTPPPHTPVGRGAHNGGDSGRGDSDSGDSNSSSSDSRAARELEEYIADMPRDQAEFDARLPKAWGTFTTGTRYLLPKRWAEVETEHGGRRYRGYLAEAAASGGRGGSGGAVAGATRPAQFDAELVCQVMHCAKVDASGATVAPARDERTIANEEARQERARAEAKERSEEACFMPVGVGWLVFFLQHDANSQGARCDAFMQPLVLGLVVAIEHNGVPDPEGSKRKGDQITVQCFTSRGYDNPYRCGRTGLLVRAHSRAVAQALHHGR